MQVPVHLQQQKCWDTRNRQKVCSSILYSQTPVKRPLLHRVEEIAKKKGVSMAQISVAWSLAKDGKIYILHVINRLQICSTTLAGVSAPIVGTTSLKNLEEMIGMPTPHPSI